MIEAIKEIGQMGTRGDPDRILEELTQPLRAQIKGKKQHVVIMDVDTREGSIKFDFEEIEEKKTPKRYLWIGNASGNNPQYYLTTNNLQYLISQAIPNLIDRLPSKSSLKLTLEQIKNNFLYNLASNGRYRYVFDFEKLGLFNKGGMKEVITNLKGPKKIVTELTKQLSDIIKTKTGLLKSEISLYTLKFNGLIGVNDKNYRNLILQEKINSLFENKNKGICSVCDEEKVTTGDTKRLTLKYYITDKVGFSSNLTGRFRDNFSLCKDCYTQVLTGESFVKNNFSSNIGMFNLYVIPNLLFKSQLCQKNFKEWAEYINLRFNAVKSFRGFHDFQRRISRYLDYEDEKNNFILNFLFYQKRQSEFKILKLIKDVSPSRLDELTVQANRLKDIADKLLGGTGNGHWKISLEQICYLIPLKITRVAGRIEITGYEKLLEVYDCMFSNKPISYFFLISQFVKLAKICRFEQFRNYNTRISNWDLALTQSVLKATLFLAYLRSLKILRGGEGGMNYEKYGLREEVKDFVKEMNYDESQTALFLLGYLMGEIGNAQYRAGSKRKPILNKIAYQGIGKERIKRLTNEIFEKLRQYRILSFNEDVFAAYKKLLDSNIRSWNLDDKENVFYVLSGYAYNTHQTMRRVEAEN